MSTTSTDALQRLLLGYFQEMAETKEENNFEQDRDAFLYHMTDCEPDLRELAEVVAHPERFDRDRAHQALQRLFYHALPHLNAAAEIYDDAPHIYQMYNKNAREGE